MPSPPAKAALPPPVLYVTCMAIAMILSQVVPLPLPSNSWTQACGFAAIIIGQGLSFWAMLRFRRQHTTASNFNAPDELLQDGPFAVSRNPINLGDTLAYVGIAGLLADIWPWLLLPILLYLMNWLVIRPDERQLNELFGETYRQYCRRVRRWL
ncbi:methyltransferase family protein [Pseudomonas sp. nanlin1]|uniref:methyltransferase family protein n=1 Tax=Pseudomonas sp. nanlin1 TaxID=3040605 RepID=UPI00388E6A71